MIDNCPSRKMMMACRSEELADMFSARKKISKEKGADPDTFEESVAQVCEIQLCMERKRMVHMPFVSMFYILWVVRFADRIWGT